MVFVQLSRRGLQSVQNFQEVVIEAALAHGYGNKVEAAYQRGDLFEKRRRLLNAWGECCGNSPAAGQVVTLRAAE